MLKEKLNGFFKLIRIRLCLFGCIVLFVSGIIAKDLIGFQFEFIIAFLITFISAAGAFAINDFYDFKIDKMNGRERPLVLGLISRRTALIISILSFLTVILLAFLLNSIAMILVFISLPLFYLYSMGLKKFIFIKNILIGYTQVGTILLGSLVIDPFLEPLTIFFAIMGFITALGYEVMFDIADIQGDKNSGINTIPNKYGLRNAAILSVILYCVIIILNPLPFFLLIDSRLYLDYIFLLLILIPIISYIIVSISLLKDQSKENTVRLKKLIFATFQLGLIAYLLGVLI